jgi:16S rRNA (cytosine1402-N4)-methyltransferase
MGHMPVMLSEVIAALQPRDGAQYIDGTFGGGGYSRAILEAADCRVLGIDRDPEAIARGQALVKQFQGRLTLILGEFSRLDSIAGPSDGIVLDLGVSSFQFDTPARGFSFREDGPLDMRMSLAGESAADFVNRAEHGTLASVIARLGEEKNARRIATAIIARTFQALRIHVNEELGELERGLDAALAVLKPAGRLVVVSFHSLEDRIVKQFFTRHGGALPRASRHLPPAARGRTLLRIITSRPQTPAAAEIAANPRARSAKLRAAERLAA